LQRAGSTRPARFFDFNLISMKRHRFFTMYLTTTVSITLLLLLVGMECVVVIGAHHLLKSIRENLTVTIVMTPTADASAVQRLKNVLEAVPYTQSYQYISKQEALQEHIETLGEDPTRFLGYNPLTDAYELHLRANYAHTDSVSVIKEQLLALPYVDKVLYQEDMLKVLDNRLNSISVLLLSAAALLLVVVWILIVNTIRLQIYARRFLIHTMRLVGATSWVIRAPFVRRSVWMGLEAGVFASVILVLLLYYIREQMGIVFFPFTWQLLLSVSGIIIATGIIITFFAALFATGKYVRMKSDKMYEI
jgi:cell division transport system permease protein